MNTTANNVIALEAVSKRYGSDTVVSDVNFTIQPGECVVLVGHNGAGKTTLMKLMLGLTRPSAGSITVQGANPTEKHSVQHPAQSPGKNSCQNHVALGYLPESVAFYDAMTGREVLAFYARLKGASIVECNDLLDIIGLSHAADRRVGTYSKGMRQRLGLAQAMLGNPQLLFLDEPTTGLDPSLRYQFYELIDALHKEGATSVISSHALNEVEARANRFFIMKKGVLIANGTLDELYRQAALPVAIKVSVTPGEASSVADRLGAGANIGHINNQTLNLSCFNGEKMALIRRISDLGEVVNDLQIMPPKLDEVYSHFMNGHVSDDGSNNNESGEIDGSRL